MIQILVVSLAFPVAMLALGLMFEVVYPGFFYYLSSVCHGLNDCLTQPAYEYLLREKTQRLLLLCWGIGLVMVFSMAYQNLKPEVYQWLRKFK